MEKKGGSAIEREEKQCSCFSVCVCVCISMTTYLRSSIRLSVSVRLCLSESATPKQRRHNTPFAPRWRRGRPSLGHTAVHTPSPLALSASVLTPRQSDADEIENEKRQTTAFENNARLVLVSFALLFSISPLSRLSPTVRTQSPLPLLSISSFLTAL